MVETEHTIIGSILGAMDTTYAEYARENLSIEHFTDASMRKIFAKLVELQQKKSTPDLENLRAAFSTQIEIYNLAVRTLKQSVGSYPRFVEEVENLRGYRVIRLLSQMGHRLSQLRVTMNPADASTLLQEAESEILQISKQAGTGGEIVHIESYVSKALDNMEKARKSTSRLLGIATPFRFLDHLTKGFQNGHLTIVAARPSVGKTTLAIQIALTAIQNNKRVIFVSLEQSGEEIAAKCMSFMNLFDSEKLKIGDLTDDEMRRVMRAAADLSQYDFHLDCGKDGKYTTVRNAIRRAHLKKRIDMIIVDYIGMFQSFDGKDHAQPRHIIVSNISRATKLLAQELDVPIVLLSQLNRNLEERANARPRLSDLRESGNLEQDADEVILLHRDRDEKGLLNNFGELMLAKNRHGKVGNIDITFSPITAQFSQKI